MVNFIVDIKLPAAGEVESDAPPGPELGSVSLDDLVASSDNGMSFKEKLELFEQRVLQEMGIKVEANSPSGGHLRVFNSSEGARDLAVRALQLAAATTALTNRLGLSDPDGDLRQVHTFISALLFLL